jgi:hypothetical protein
VAALVELPEAEALVEADRRVVVLDAEAEPAEAVALRPRDQRLQHLLAEAAAAPAGDDRDRQLGRVLVDEAVARLVLLEQAGPRGADRKAFVERDDARVALPAPRHHVSVDGLLVLAGRHLTAVEGVVEHVAQETNVARLHSPDHRRNS